MTLDDYYKKMIEIQNQKTKQDNLLLKQFQESPDEFNIKLRFSDYDTERKYVITRKSDGYKINLQSDHALAPKLNALIQVRNLEQVQYVKGLLKKLQWWKK